MLSVSTIHIALSLFLALPPDDLSREITEVLERISHPSSKVSFKAVRLKTGEPIVDFNAEDMLVPASLQKLFTTAATLDALGTDHVFKLDLFADAPIEGTIQGSLTIRSDGDPWLIPERIWYAAQRLKYMGVRRINGDIIVDGSAFDGPLFAAGLEQDESSSSYMAPAGALSVGFNSVLVHVYPAQKSGSPRRLLSNPGHPKSSFNQKPPPNLIVGVESKSISKNVKMVKMLSRLPDKSRLGANHWVTGEESHDLTVMREQSSSQF